MNGELTVSGKKGADTYACLSLVQCRSRVVGLRRGGRARSGGHGGQGVPEKSRKARSSDDGREWMVIQELL